MPFFLRILIACVLRCMVIFWPSTIKVFFCRLGFQTFLVCLCEKLTLWPYCLPLPVSSQVDAIIIKSLLQSYIYYCFMSFKSRSARDDIIRYMTGLSLFYLFVVLVSILVSMTLHEAMHAYMGHWLGDDTAKLQGRLTLNPLAHIDPITTVALPLLLVMLGAPPFGAAKPVPFNPNQVKYGDYGAALVALAGPLTNLFLAIAAGLALRFFGQDMDAMIVAAVYTFVVVNISFFVFNMIPFPPLDGSRVLYAFAPDGFRAIMERIESAGFMAIIVFMMLFYAVLVEPFSRVVEYVIRLIIG